MVDSYNVEYSLIKHCRVKRWVYSDLQFYKSTSIWKKMSTSKESQ